MKLNLLEHGDNLEREYSGFIQNYLPSYEMIWSRYIGNDGTNKMIGLKNFDKDEQRARELFAQYHYTILESFASLDILTNDLKIFRVNEEYKVQSLLHFNNLLLAYWGNIGRIRDNISEILNKMDLSKLICKIDKYYQTRNEILHGRKIPYSIIDGELLIPVIEDGTVIKEAWHENKSWFEVNRDNFKVMSDFHEESFMEYLTIINTLLYNVLQKIIIICENKNILLTPLQDVNYTVLRDSSGSADYVSVTEVKK